MLLSLLSVSHALVLENEECSNELVEVEYCTGVDCLTQSVEYTSSCVVEDCLVFGLVETDPSNVVCSNGCLSKYDACPTDECARYGSSSSTSWSSCASKENQCTSTCVQFDCKDTCVKTESKTTCKDVCDNYVTTKTCVSVKRYWSTCGSGWFNYPCLKSYCSQYSYSTTCASTYVSCTIENVCVETRNICGYNCLKSETTCSDVCVGGYVTSTSTYCAVPETYDCEPYISCESDSGPCSQQEFTSGCIESSISYETCTKIKTLYYDNQTICITQKPVISGVQVCNLNDDCELDSLIVGGEYVLKFFVERIYHNGQTKFTTTINDQSVTLESSDYKNTIGNYPFIASTNNNEFLIQVIDEITGLTTSELITYQTSTAVIERTVYEIKPNPGKGEESYFSEDELSYLSTVKGFVSNSGGSNVFSFFSNPAFITILISGFAYLFLKNDIKNGLKRTEELLEALSGSYDENNAFGTKFDAIKLSIAGSQLTPLAPFAFVLDTGIDIMEVFLNLFFFMFNGIRGDFDSAKKNLFIGSFAMIGVIPIFGDFIQDGSRANKLIKNILKKGDLRRIKYLPRKTPLTVKKLNSLIPKLDSTNNFLIRNKLKVKKLEYLTVDLQGTFSSKGLKEGAHDIIWATRQGTAAFDHEYAHLIVDSSKDIRFNKINDDLVEELVADILPKKWQTITEQKQVTKALKNQKLYEITETVEKISKDIKIRKGIHKSLLEVAGMQNAVAKAYGVDNTNKYVKAFDLDKGALLAETNKQLQKAQEIINQFK